jgi:hypothetical protein
VTGPVNYREPPVPAFDLDGTLAPIGGVTARQVAEEAMQAIGVDPLSGDGDGEAGVPGTGLAPRVP